MPRENDGRVGEFGQADQALVHRLGIGAGKIGPSAALEKQGVAGDEAAPDEKTLAPGGVSGCVDAGDFHAADQNHVAGAAGSQVVGADAGRALHPGELVLVHVDRDVMGRQEGGDALDVVAEEGSADMVGVVVGDEGPGDAHAIGFGGDHEVGHPVGGIDHEAFPGGTVADEVGEVDHLAGHGVVVGEVASAEQLAEIQTVVGGSAHAGHTRGMGEGLALKAGDRLLVGSTMVEVDAATADAVTAGGRLLGVAATGRLRVIPAAVDGLASSAVGAAIGAFSELAALPDEAFDRFYSEAARLLADDATFAAVAAANDADVESARARGRSTTRLQLGARMRADMVEAFGMWADLDGGRDRVLSRTVHDGWTVEEQSAPLGVVGFVFEGRPNVFADATGVLRTGNTVVFRIGSDALGTARALMEAVIGPAIERAGLPTGAVQLLDSPEHAAGWALFSDPRIALAVARGSGEAVAELGAIARQSGVPVSLHGTGGAWIIAGRTADAGRLSAAVEHSLDRKVCNTVNVVCVVRERASELVPIVVSAADRAATRRGTRARIHAVGGAEGLCGTPEEIEVRRADAVVQEVRVTPGREEDLGHEFEWEENPEFHLVVVESIDHAVDLFNTLSPRFVASLLADELEAAPVLARIDAPFLGDGFTRWVDGQYALGRPELGLSNWQNGRLLARGGILSGDAVSTVRMRVRQHDPDVHR